MWGRKLRKFRVFFSFSFLFFSFRMCWRLYDYHGKTSRYRKGLTHLINRETTNQNKTLHSQKLKRKEQKNKIKGNHRTTTTKKEQRRNRINWKTKFKMSISTYLSISTLNVSGLNASIKRHRMADWIKKTRA